MLYVTRLNKERNMNKEYGLSIREFIRRIL